MRKELAVVIITLMLAAALHPVAAQPRSPVVREKLRIVQVYNQVIVVSITDVEGPPKLSLPEDPSKGLEALFLGVANITAESRLARWFYGYLNPQLNTSKFVYWRGAVLNVTYSPALNSSVARERADAMAKWASKQWRLGLRPAICGNHSFTYVSPADYDVLIGRIVESLSSRVESGLYSTVVNMGVQYASMLFNGDETRYVLISYTGLSGMDDKVRKHEWIDYLKLLGSISSYPGSVDSSVEMMIYGLAVNETSVQGISPPSWVSGLRNNWITRGIMKMEPGSNITKLSLRLAYFSVPPLVLVKPLNPAPKPGKKFTLEVTVRNLDSIEVKGVEVELPLPGNITAASSSKLRFGDLGPRESLTKRVYVSADVNGTFVFPAPRYTYVFGETTVEMLGNQYSVAVGADSYASLVALIYPLTRPDRVTGGGIIDYNVSISNVGNFVAKNVWIKMGSYKYDLGDITAGRTVNTTLTYDPTLKRFMSNVPEGAVSNPPLVVGYRNGSLNVELGVNSVAALPSQSVTFSNHVLIYPVYTGERVFKGGSMVLRWTLFGLGGSEPVRIELNQARLVKMGLIHQSGDDFLSTGNILRAAKSVLIGSNTSLGLFLKTKKNDVFLIPAMFVRHPSNLPDALIEPATVTNAIRVKKDGKPEVLRLGGNVTVTVTVSNLGSRPIYDVHVNDTIPEGWRLVAGSPHTYVSTLDAGRVVKISYVISAVNPENSSLPPARVDMNMGGEDVVLHSNRVMLKVLINIYFHVLTAYNESVPKATLRLVDLDTGEGYNVTVENGVGRWVGYIGRFATQVIYRGRIIYDRDILITRSNSTPTINVELYMVGIAVRDVFGSPLAGARVEFIRNGEKVASYVAGSDGLANCTLVPGGTYTILIHFGNLDVREVLTIDKNVRIFRVGVPAIVVGTYAIDVKGVAAIVLLALVVAGLLGIHLVKKAKPVRKGRKKVAKRRKRPRKR